MNAPSLASVQWTRTTFISVFSSRRPNLSLGKGDGFFNVDAANLTLVAGAGLEPATLSV